MDMVTLGRTGITVNKNGFGALPIQRVSHGGRGSTCPQGLQGRHHASLIPPAPTPTARTSWARPSTASAARCTSPPRPAATERGGASGKTCRPACTNLQTDYVDLYQFHNPAFCPKPGDGTGLYEAMLEAKEQGKIRHIGITNHRLSVAREAIESGLYETLQFPFSYIWPASRSWSWSTPARSMRWALSP